MSISTDPRLWTAEIYNRQHTYSMFVFRSRAGLSPDSHETEFFTTYCHIPVRQSIKSIRRCHPSQVSPKAISTTYIDDDGGGARGIDNDGGGQAELGDIPHSAARSLARYFMGKTTEVPRSPL